MKHLNQNVNTPNNALSSNNTMEYLTIYIPLMCQQ